MCIRTRTPCQQSKYLVKNARAIEGTRTGKALDREVGSLALARPLPHIPFWSNQGHPTWPKEPTSPNGTSQISVPLS